MGALKDLEGRIRELKLGGILWGLSFAVEGLRFGGFGSLHGSLLVCQKTPPALRCVAACVLTRLTRP